LSASVEQTSKKDATGEAWIIDAVRTPRRKGKKDGAPAEIHLQELMAQVLNAPKDRNHLNPLDGEDVVVGCVTPYREQARCISRVSVLAAEWPNDSTGVTINRFCGSGQQKVSSPPSFYSRRSGRIAS
jgi:acetyl-CoA C-acetyltransferase